MSQFGRNDAERDRAAINKAFQRQQQQLASLSERIHRLEQRPQQVASPYRAYDSSLEKFREHEQRYANTILLLGYGGFFALWSTTSDTMPKAWFGACGLSMGLSLLIFICYELIKVAAASWARKPSDPLAELEATNAAIDRWNKRWPVFFFPAVALGLFAGFTLLFWFGQHALTGR